MSVDSDRMDRTDALPRGLYHLDPVHTFVMFSVRHAIVGRVDGRFNTIAGSFIVTDEPTRPFDLIEVGIEAASIDTKVDARDDDLRSRRFFEVASFPNLMFRGRSEPTAESDLRIVGDLTIRDVVRLVTLEAAVRGAKVDTHGRTRMGATVTTALTRRDFGLTTELEQESGDSSEPDIQVRIDIEAVLKSESAK